MAQWRLASAGDSIQFWDLREYSLVKQFNPHSGNVSSICWSQNNDVSFDKKCEKLKLQKPLIAMVSIGLSSAFYMFFAKM